MFSAKILLVHQGAIGDLVLSIPALETIKKAFPGRAVEMLGYPGILSLVSGHIAGSIGSADGALVSSLYGDFAGVPVRMQQYLASFERIFIFSNRKSNTFFENVERCNPATVLIKTFPDISRHVIDYQLAQLAARGFEPAWSSGQLAVSDHDRSRAEQYLQEHAFETTPGPRIAVHAGSGGRHKCWPHEFFAFVMQRLHEQLHAGFMLVQGPAEDEYAEAMMAVPGEANCIVLRSLDLPLVAALLSRCSLFVGNDSGITHMAAALGVPTVAVFGPTDPAVWGPRGRAVCCVSDQDQAGKWRWPGPEAVLRSASSLLAVDK